MEWGCRGGKRCLGGTRLRGRGGERRGSDGRNQSSEGGINNYIYLVFQGGLLLWQEDDLLRWVESILEADTQVIQAPGQTTVDKGDVIYDHSQDKQDWNSKKIFTRKPGVHGGIITPEIWEERLPQRAQRFTRGF
jgi:hypothetical protein